MIILAYVLKNPLLWRMLYGTTQLNNIRLAGLKIKTEEESV
jgi:hypothetical protein